MCCTVIKACAAQPCANEGACSMSESDPDDYVCKCLAGLNGKTCRSKLTHGQYTLTPVNNDQLSY